MKVRRYSSAWTYGGGGGDDDDDRLNIPVQVMKACTVSGAKIQF